MLGKVLTPLFVYLMAAGILLAQGTTSRVVGLIQDPAGAAVALADIRLVNEATSVVFDTKSAANGAYYFEAVQSGKYTVTVELAGFRKFSAKGNVVSIGQPVTINVMLEIGQVTEKVEVSAVYEAVQTSTSGNIGNLFSDRMLRDLAILNPSTRGRNPLDLVYLQPGVVSGANAGGGSHVHGARDRAWNYTLDGVDSNETSFGGSNLSPTRTNPDSLAEFRVITSNATAEYGRNSGAQVAMVTRSGGNEVHGSLFELYRTPRLNANEWESNLNNLGKKQYVQHIFGGSVGGPIIRNKTFFFVNIQALRALQTAQVDRVVLTADARRGIFRYVKGGRNRPYGVSGASIDANGNPLAGLNIGTYNMGTSDPQGLGLDKAIQASLSSMPLPNNWAYGSGDGLNTAGYTFVAPEWERQRDHTVKVDHIFSPTNMVFARIAWGHQNTLCDGANGGRPLYPGMSCPENTLRLPRNMAFNWRWNLRPSVTNELVFGENRFTFDFPQPLAGIDKLTLNPPLSIYIPESYYTVSNLRRLRTYQIIDNLAWFRGAHSLKFGTNIRLQQHNDVRGSVAGYYITQNSDFSTSTNTVDPATFGLPADLNTTYDQPTFQSGINFLLGRVGGINRSFVQQGDKFVSDFYSFKANFPEYDFYAQDTWRVRKNLTIDLGLRWEMKLTPSNPDNLISHPNALMTAGATPTNTVRWVPGSVFDSNYGNFAPSIGLAWDPRGAGRMSVRANYRMAYDRLNTFVLSSAVFQSLPGSTLGVANNDYGQSGGRLSGMPVLTAGGVKPSDLTQPIPFSSAINTVVDPGMKTPITHMWSLSLQKEIANRTVLDVTYIGRRAYHLLGAYNANQIDIWHSGFLDAFKTVKAGGESDLINRLTSADSRLKSGETGSQMVRRLYASDLNLNSVAAIANSLATRLQSGRSVTDLSGAGPFALLSFPQYGGGLRVIDSNDYSTYHAVEIQIERRMASGLTYQASYTLSKALDTRSYDPTQTIYGTANSQSATSTPFDIYNRDLNYATSDFDRTHVFQSYSVYELPFGKGKKLGAHLNGAMARVVGGWQIGSGLRIQSGRPMTIFSGSYTYGSVQQSTANCTGCSRQLGSVIDLDGYKWYLSAAERAQFSAPAAGELGNTGRNYFRGPGLFNLDFSVIKRTRLNERFNLELRGEAANLTNTPSFGFPTLIYTSSTFGRIRDTVSSYSRKIQIGAKLNF